MDRDELREKIADILKNCTTFTNEPYDYADRILSALAPVLADAEKWRKVKEIIDPSQLRALAAWIDIKYPNDPNPHVQNDLRKWANALEGEGEKG